MSADISCPGVIFGRKKMSADIWLGSNVQGKYFHTANTQIHSGHELERKAMINSYGGEKKNCKFSNRQRRRKLIKKNKRPCSTLYQDSTLTRPPQGDAFHL